MYMYIIYSNTLNLLLQVMCHRYWPDETTGSEMHGPFEISLHSIREYPDYVLREIQIVDTRVRAEHKNYCA